MTSMWLHPDRWASRNYNKILIVLTIYFKYFEPFWTPYLKDQPHRLDIKRKVLWCCTFLVQNTTVQKFLTVLKIYVQVSFRGRTCNYLKGHTETKRKVNIVHTFILNNLSFIMLVKCLSFSIYEVKDLRFWSLKSIIM